MDFRTAIRSKVSPSFLRDLWEWRVGGVEHGLETGVICGIKFKRSTGIPTGRYIDIRELIGSDYVRIRIRSVGQRRLNL